MPLTYGISHPEFVGQFPIRQELEVIPGDPECNLHGQIIITSKNKIRSDGGNRLKETIGIAVVNPRGVSAGRKSIVVGK